MTPDPFELPEGLASRTRLNDGAEMPVLGLGVYQTPVGERTFAAVAAALEAGYRSIDTAALYGNEGDVGRAVRASGVPREEVFVTTKVWNSDQGYDRTLRAYRRSRELLDVGPVDLYLVHWPVRGRRTETWRALVELQRRGEVRSIGVSNFTADHLEELRRESDVIPAVNQVEFSPVVYQGELLEYCRDRGIQLEAWAPLGRGRWVDHDGVQRIARGHGRTPAQVLIRWGLQHHVVEIPKSAQPVRIRENAQVGGFALTAAEMLALDRMRQGVRTGWDPTDEP